MEGGEMKVHDAPHTETREQFGGLYIIEARDMDEALNRAIGLSSDDAVRACLQRQIEALQDG